MSERSLNAVITMKKFAPLAIVYDFDGTLAPGNMQERDFIPQIGMTKKTFWDEVSKECKARNADNILIYMWLMLEKAQAAKVQVRRSDFRSYGKTLEFFDGVLPEKKDGTTIKGWFDRIDEYGKQSAVNIQHFVVSSGVREMVEGTPVKKRFRAIFASSFCYDHHGIAKWPALALNYTSKTQYLFRINKGTLDVYDHKDINKYVPEQDREVPFTNMIYIGDGETDIPCFRLVKDRGGASIAVYKPHKKGAQNICKSMVKDGRINYFAPADYRDGSRLDRIVKAFVDKVSTDSYLNHLRA